MEEMDEIEIYVAIADYVPEEESNIPLHCGQHVQVCVCLCVCLCLCLYTYTCVCVVSEFVCIVFYYVSMCVCVYNSMPIMYNTYCTLKLIRYTVLPSHLCPSGVRFLTRRLVAGVANGDD